MLWQPDIIAQVTLLPTFEGGRKSATPSNYFGCPLGFENEYFDVRLDLSEVGSVAPGDTVRVPAKFVCPDLIKSRFSVGSIFILWEGKKIGEGKVLEVINI